MKMIVFSGFSYFWYLVPVYQEVTMLFGFFDLLDGSFIRKCFMRYSSFTHELNSNLWMET